MKTLNAFLDFPSILCDSISIPHVKKKVLLYIVFKLSRLFSLEVQLFNTFLNLHKRELMVPGFAEDGLFRTQKGMVGSYRILAEN